MIVRRDRPAPTVSWQWHQQFPGRRADSDNLPPPDVIVQEMVDDLEAAWEQFKWIAGDLNGAEAEAWCA